MAQHVRLNEIPTSDSTAELGQAEFAKAVQSMMDGLAKEHGLSRNAKNLGILAAATADAITAGSTASGLPTTEVAALLRTIVSKAFHASASLEPQRIATLPPERNIWESVGGKFRSSSSEMANRVRQHVSFELLTHNSVVGDSEMAEVLGVDRTRISQKVKEKSLYSFESPEGRCFPRWQIVDGKPIRELKKLVAALDPALHPLTVDHWIETRNSDLEIAGQPVTPTQWLVTGGSIDVVAELAAQL